MNTSLLNEKVAGLATLSPGQLRIEWRRAFRSAPPALSKDLMVRFIAWKLQVKAHGNVSTSSSNLLAAIAAGDNGGAGSPAGKLKPGTRIVREWNGRLLCVSVTEGGFSFEDRPYGSLSEIAREVTGAHWSGPRFFGLQRRTASKAATGAK
jgi:hypothetical protein